MSHTPGPWTQDEYGSVKTPSGETLLVEGVALAGRSTEETRANARLIAAAPDLLAALKLAFQALDAIGDEMTVGERYTNAGQYLIDSLNPARDAIKKAEGQS